jgi:hypothetical protein
MYLKILDFQMKFALIFLMSALVVVTNQQYLRNYPARSLAWWLPKPPPILNRYQQHYYEQPTIEADVPYFRYAKPMIKNHRPVLVYAQVKLNSIRKIPPFLLLMSFFNSRKMRNC